MDVHALLPGQSLLGSPLTFAVLCASATWFVCLALRPARSSREVRHRLHGYLEQADVVEDADMRKPFAARVLVPLVLRILRLLGRLAPRRSVQATRRILLQAGEPGGLTVLDFYGLRILLTVGVCGGWLWVMGNRLPLTNLVLGAVVAAVVGFFLPILWVRGRADRRKREIMRALPNALDMLTIGVEAGLACESAMTRVVERWDNALSQEFRRALVEMRVGASRNEALQRLADRSDVPDLRSFVAVLVQSTQLGASIAKVLHVQAAQIREKRRLRAEELARKAGTKMMFPLVFLIFPCMFIVILGPALPVIMGTLTNLGGG